MPLLHCIYIVLRLIKICKIQPPDLYFLLLLLAFISRYYCSQIFNHSTISEKKKDFCHKFCFLTDSLKPTHPLDSQNLLSVAKVFCQCSINVAEESKQLETRLENLISKTNVLEKELKELIKQENLFLKHNLSYI